MLSALRQVGRRAFTVERALLCGVLALQAAILACSIRNRGAAPTAGSDAAAQPALAAGMADWPVLAPESIAADPRHAAGMLPTPGTDTAEDALNRAMHIHARMSQAMERAFEEMGQIRAWTDLDRGWERLVSFPAMDMRERGDAYVVVFCLPESVSEEEVDVTLEDRLLTVLAPLRAPGGPARRPAAFERRVQLPGPVGDGEPARAAMTNRILRVVVPKGHGAVTVGKRTRLL